MDQIHFSNRNRGSLKDHSCQIVSKSTTRRLCLYTIRHKFSETFRAYKFLQKNNQFVLLCYPCLPVVCWAYQNAIWSFCLIYTVSCIHLPLFWGVPLKSVTAQPKMLTLNSNKRRSNLDLFFKIVSNWFCRTPGFMSVIEDHSES